MTVIPIIAHDTGSGYVWWDELLFLAVPIVIAVGVVLWLARRARVGQSDDD